MPFLSMCRRGCHRTGNVQLGRLEAVSTQGLASSELFRLVQSGSDKLVVEPILQSLEVAVRAIVIPVVDPEVAFMLYRHAREVRTTNMDYHASCLTRDPLLESKSNCDDCVRCLSQLSPVKGQTCIGKTPWNTTQACIMQAIIRIHRRQAPLKSTRKVWLYGRPLKKCARSQLCSIE
mmetsp:Transcript_4198/g.15082  ORF Transcript_4198/g.15082 Transcript_4198/m.15082 type:complete len:177 (+) Transcript_4198:558-1088(+)